MPSLEDAKRKRTRDVISADGYVVENQKKKHAKEIDLIEPVLQEGDKKLKCKACKKSFVWSAKEQLYFRAKRLKNVPNRCKPCIKKKKKNEKKRDSSGKALQVCREFAKGGSAECFRKNGRGCRFVHLEVKEVRGVRQNNFCYQFLQGNCKVGRRCRKVHPKKAHLEIVNALKRMAGEVVPEDEEKVSFQSVKPCFEFQRGECERGADCKFSHVGLVEPANKPKSSKPCFEFQRGECERGADCKFSHVGLVEPANNPKSSKPCFEFKRGECARGADCKFSHNLAEVPGVPEVPVVPVPEKKVSKAAKSKKPCFEFERGECSRSADACKFSHNI